ncbi:type IA DNA topoisomerase [Campylobacter troglodytis]|uniref:type IA DNA topoisomerase n=1 Tax=Campylobacter troglodytis TaxID=654363 RepID=UPI00115B9BDC|nr:type IA DNA topoisomerase [Campylobacter troglodytis]TQR56274.1 type IA DNA topoisomerase [Campylobacter troglodytis]
MSESIIIIESPNKREKIQKITGFDTYATIGHFKTLTKNFITNYENYESEFDFKDEDAKKRMNSIFSKCVDKEVIIATDPDREGYAIGYLFYQMIKNKAKSIKRAEFHEITESGIKKGLENAVPFTNTNFKEFEAFKARAVGDKLVGFILSPKYMNLAGDKNVSIGRVQSPALNLIVSKDEEIQAFNALKEEEKVSYKARAKCQINDIEFSIDSKKILKDKTEFQGFLDFLNQSKEAIFTQMQKNESKKSPAKPFRTSQLQEKANQVLGFAPDETMLLAQNLFENGLITYTRTDSNALSEDFLNEVENALKDKEYYQRRVYKAGEQSQADAHEAIRITHIHEFSEIDNIFTKANNENAKLNDKHKKLYELIYKNSICSQAKDKITEINTFEFTINGALFTTSTKKTLYKGFESIFNEEEEESDENEQESSQNNNVDLSSLQVNDKATILSIESIEVKKSAPSPYKESSFISLLEKEGIGRPSTYASFLPTLLKRQYVELKAKGKNKLIMPTAKGIQVIKLLREKDEWIIQSEYTKLMEDLLDSITKGEIGYIDFIKPLHSKMNFEKINNAGSEASQKQIELVEKLCKEQGKEVPTEIFNDFAKTKAFIDELIKASQTNKAPSEKQISFAENLAQKNNVELPQDYKTRRLILLAKIL